MHIKERGHDAKKLPEPCRPSSPLETAVPGHIINMEYSPLSDTTSLSELPNVW